MWSSRRISILSILLALLRHNFIYSWATIRRSVVDDVGGFRDDLASCEDHDLWLRAAAFGYEVVQAPGRLALYRRGRPTLTYDAMGTANASYEVYRTVAENLAVSPEVRDAAQRRLQALRREVTVLTGERPLASAVRRLKHRAIPVKQRMLDRRMWYPESPGEVADAFPELIASRRVRS